MRRRRRARRALLAPRSRQHQQRWRYGSPGDPTRVTYRTGSSSRPSLAAWRRGMTPAGRTPQHQERPRCRPLLPRRQMRSCKPAARAKGDLISRAWPLRGPRHTSTTAPSLGVPREEAERMGRLEVETVDNLAVFEVPYSISEEAPQRWRRRFGRARGPPEPATGRTSLVLLAIQQPHVGGLGALRPRRHVELDGLPLIKRAVASRLDRAEMHEDILARLRRDEAVALLSVEPLHGSSHETCPSLHRLGGIGHTGTIGAGGKGQAQPAGCEAKREPLPSHHRRVRHHPPPTQAPSRPAGSQTPTP